MTSQPRFFSDFNAFTDFVVSNRKKKDLHPVAEENLRIFLKEIYPESHTVNESNVNGGRVDLIFFFDSLQHTIHFEIFASYSTVVKDLRLLEQSEFDIQVAILIDEEIDPSVYKKYFRERPTKSFPFFNLSQIFIESKIDDFKRGVSNIIKTFQFRPDSEVMSLRKSLLRCYEAIKRLCYFQFEYEEKQGLSHKDEIEKALTLLTKYKEDLNEYLDFHFDVDRVKDSRFKGNITRRPTYKITLDKIKIDIFMDVTGKAYGVFGTSNEVESDMILYKSDLNPFLNNLKEKILL